MASLWKEAERIAPDLMRILQAVGDCTRNARGDGTLAVEQLKGLVALCVLCNSRYVFWYIMSCTCLARIKNRLCNMYCLCPLMHTFLITAHLIKYAYVNITLTFNAAAQTRPICYSCLCH